MALREMNNAGRLIEVLSLPHIEDFERTWFAIGLADRAAIEAEINARLDRLVNSPDANWGSITNTSIEGGKVNPVTGIRGDWSGTVFDAIFEACNLNENLAGMFYGNVWKKVIIDRDDPWIGMRADPTFPNRGITLQGKTYFLDKGAAVVISARFGIKAALNESLPIIKATKRGLGCVQLAHVHQDAKCCASVCH